MFVGHYGASFLAKRLAPTIPLWHLFIAVQWLDVVWSPLVLLGVEKVRIVPGFTASNPLDLYYMPYTHSLAAALMWSAVMGVVYRVVSRERKWTTALVIAGAVFSHWLLDWVVHRPDLPLYANTRKVGLGLWNMVWIAFATETLLLFGGMYVYLSAGSTRRMPIIVFGVLMLVVHANTFFGSPPQSDRAAAILALAAYIVFALAIGFLEAKPTITAQN